MVAMTDSSKLRFDGSLWCNLDIALRNLDQIYGQSINPLGLNIIEWYILRALLEEDSRHASELARSVGRAATSFTPILDKLQEKGLIERKADPSDRRAVRITLTDKARQQKRAITEVANRIEKWLNGTIDKSELDTFLRVLLHLQNLQLA
jgi:MarR family transcriptional regulator, organic hydroperoxide resistance regulator